MLRLKLQIKIQKKNIEIGISDGINVEIISGINLNDRVKVWNRTQTENLESEKIQMTKMRINKILIVLIVALTSPEINCQSKVWTLEECIELAIEKNISVKQGQLNYEDALIDKKTLKRIFCQLLTLMQIIHGILV